jgi:hypothetical protein
MYHAPTPLHACCARPQVNPHAILFFYEPNGSPGVPSPHPVGSRLRGGFALATLEVLLKLEMRKWASLMADMGERLG